MLKCQKLLHSGKFHTLTHIRHQCAVLSNKLTPNARLTEAAHRAGVSIPRLMSGAACMLRECHLFHHGNVSVSTGG